MQAAEEADDAEGAHEAEDGDGYVGVAEGDEGHEDDEGVEQAPGVGEEGAEPVGEEVDEQLRREDGGEGVVGRVHAPPQRRLAAGAVGELVDELRLEQVHHEVLHIIHTNTHTHAHTHTRARARTHTHTHSRLTTKLCESPPPTPGVCCGDAEAAAEAGDGLSHRRDEECGTVLERLGYVYPSHARLRLAKVGLDLGLLPGRIDQALELARHLLLQLAGARLQVVRPTRVVAVGNGGNLQGVHKEPGRALLLAHGLGRQIPRSAH